MLSQTRHTSYKVLTQSDFARHFSNIITRNGEQLLVFATMRHVSTHHTVQAYANVSTNAVTANAWALPTNARNAACFGAPPTAQRRIAALAA